MAGWQAGWQAAIALLMVLCFGSFAWAIAGHFHRSGNLNRKMRLLGLTGIVAILLQLVAVWFGSVVVWRGVAGLVLLVTSLSLFWWAVSETRQSRLPVAFDRSHSDAIVQSGPYALVRHPFYLSYSIAWIGGAIGSGAWWGWIAPLVLIPVYVGLAVREERVLLGAPALRGGEYRRYRARTGMVLPRLFGRSGERGVPERSAKGV